MKRVVEPGASVMISRIRRSPFDVVVVLVCISIAALIVYPLAGTVWRTVTGDEGSVVEGISRVYGNPDFGTLMWNTALIVGVSVSISVITGSFLAWLNERTDARLGWASDVLPVVSLLVPSIAGAIGWIFLASPGVGYLNILLSKIGSFLGVSSPEFNIASHAGLIFVYSLYMIPQVYLVVAAAMRNIDPSIEEAARISGARGFAVVRTITIPAVRPAIISGALLSLVYGLAMFSIPVIIGTPADIPVLTVEIVRLLTSSYPPDLLGAMLLSLVLVVLVLALNSISRLIAARGRYATIAGKPAGTTVFRLRSANRVAMRSVLVIYLLLTCIMPMLALIYVALQPFWTGTFTSRLELDAFVNLFRAGSQTASALGNSVVLGVVTATLCIFVAVLASYGMRRQLGILKPLSGILKLPGVVSHVVVAIGFVAVFAGPPLNLGGTVAILLLAYVVIYMTQATVAAESATLQIGKDLTDASLVAGRGPAYTLRVVSLPLMLPALAAGWVFVFALVMNDVTASAILAGTNSPVVGFTMLSLFENGTYSGVASLGVVVTLFTMVVVMAALIWSSRGGRRRVRR